MLPGKRLVPDGCPKQERLRRRVSSLFLNNTLSALDACELARDAEAAGAGNIRGLARIGERRKDGVPQELPLAPTVLVRSRGVRPQRAEERQDHAAHAAPHEVFSVMHEKRRTDEALCDRSHLQPGELQKHAAAATALCPADCTLTEHGRLAACFKSFLGIVQSMPCSTPEADSWLAIRRHLSLHITILRRSGPDNKITTSPNQHVRRLKPQIHEVTLHRCYRAGSQAPTSLLPVLRRAQEAAQSPWPASGCGATACP